MANVEIDPSYVYYELKAGRSDGRTPLESSHGRVGVGTWLSRPFASRGFCGGPSGFSSAAAVV